MRYGQIHPRVLIFTIASTCVLAWMGACARPLVPPDSETAAAVPLPLSRHVTHWHKGSGLEDTAFETNCDVLQNDDDREEVLESIRLCLSVNFDGTVVQHEVHFRLVPDRNFQVIRPGGRSGPPPRLPPA